MRYSATFIAKKRPSLNGSIHQLEGTAAMAGESCHEFEATDNIKVCRMMEGKEFEVKLVAGELVKNDKLYGPASLRDKTLIYPCDLFKCRVRCPCTMCRKKIGYCEDFEDHETFHRANHTNCRFCANLESIIPHFDYKIEFERVYYPAVRPQFERFFLRLGSASLFKHTYTAQPVWKKDSMFHCDKCEKTFKKMSELKRHEFSVHFGKKENCPYCGLKSSRKDNLEAHIRLVHGFKSKSLQCEVCQETFNKKSNFQRHVSNTRTNCSICSDIFCTLKQLQQHRKECHPCSKYGRAFQDQANLDRHVEASATSFKCEMCDKDHCTLLEFKKHKKIHEHQSDIECCHCKKMFSSKFNMKTHIANRSEHKCGKCGEMFCNGRGLMLHHSLIHDIKTCDICSKTLSQKNYKWHMYSEHQQLVEIE
jgi:hypothetical protein